LVNKLFTDVNKLFIYMAYFAGTLFVLLGVTVLLANWVPDEYAQYRVIMGVVLILYGAYRIIITYTKQKNAERDGN